MSIRRIEFAERTITFKDIPVCKYNKTVKD